jgi:hypothetical protein
MRALVLVAALALSGYAQSVSPELEPAMLTCADDDAACLEAVPRPSVDVAGVQTAPDDARQPGEDEPFIINSGFGD